MRCHPQAGAGDREAVDEESTCKISLSEEKIAEKQPFGLLNPDKVGESKLPLQQVGFRLFSSPTAVAVGVL